MKKILALFALCAVTSWGFAQISLNFSSYEDFSGVAADTELDFNGITLCAGPTGAKADFGARDGSNKTINEVSYTKRFKFNGAGYSGAANTHTEVEMQGICNNMPTQRYIKINVNGAGTLKAAGTPGSAQDRTLFVTDGTTYIGSLNYKNGVAEELSLSYPNVSTLYLFCNASCNLYSLEVSTASAISLVENAAKYQLLPEGIEIEGSNVSVKFYNGVSSQLIKEANGNFVSTSDLSKGSYIVTIVADGSTATFKILK